MLLILDWIHWGVVTTLILAQLYAYLAVAATIARVAIEGEPGEASLSILQWGDVITMHEEHAFRAPVNASPAPIPYKERP